MKALIMALVLSLPVVAAAQPPAPRQLAPITPTQVEQLRLYGSAPSAFSVGWDAIASLPVADRQILRGFYRQRDGWFVLVVEDEIGTVLAQSPVWQLPVWLESITLTALHTDGLPWPLGVDGGVGAVVVFGYDRVTGQAVRFRIVWPSRRLDEPTTIR